MGLKASTGTATYLLMLLPIMTERTGAQHVVDREKEIQQYLHRMERVLTQAERMHSSTHVQPARRRHSLSNSQESLKQFSCALNEDPEQVLPAQGLPSFASEAPQRQAAPRRAASAADRQESGTQGAHTREGDRVSGAGGDPGDLLRQTQPDGAGLLDTSATLADWILRSTSSSAGASQRGSDEAAELEVRRNESAAADGAPPSQLLDSLASLSEWTLPPGSAQQESGVPWRARSPVSFPVVLSENPSPSRATSSLLKPGLGSYPGPSGSRSMAATSACATPDTEDTADSGSPSDRRQSCADSGQLGQPAGRLGGPKSATGESERAAGGSRGEVTRRAAKSCDGSMSDAASAGRPVRRVLPPSAGASIDSGTIVRQTDGSANERARSSEMARAKPGSSSTQPRQVALCEEDAEGFNGASISLGAIPAERAMSGGGERGRGQVPALQKLKARARSRQRASLHGADMAPAVPVLHDPAPATQGLKLVNADEPTPGGTATSAETPLQKRGVDVRDVAPPHAATDVPVTQPAEEELVFKASRQLPRSPVKGSPNATGPPIRAQPPTMSFKADSEVSPSPPLPEGGRPAQQAGAEQPELYSLALRHERDAALEPAAALHQMPPCAAEDPILAASPCQAEPSPGSGILAVVASLLSAKTPVRQRNVGDESKVFTPSHALARSPPRQGGAPARADEGSDSGRCLSRSGSCSFPQQGDSNAALLETPRMATVAPQSPPRPARARMGDAVVEDAPPLASRCSTPSRADGLQIRQERTPLPRLPLGPSTHAVHALQQDAPCRDSPRHAGAAPTRLPRPPSASTPRRSSRPSSAGATALPAGQSGLPTAQSSEPLRASAFLSVQALQQADRLLGALDLKAEPTQAGTAPASAAESAAGALQQAGRALKGLSTPGCPPSHQSVSRAGAPRVDPKDLPAPEEARRPVSASKGASDKARSPTRRQSTGRQGTPQTSEDSRRPVSAGKLAAVRADSGLASSPSGRAQAQERRQSLVEPGASSGAPRSTASPIPRPKTSPAASGVLEWQLSDRLRAKSSSSRSSPEKPVMKRRLSLGAPQRVRSPAQVPDAPSFPGVTKPAARSGRAGTARPKGADSPPPKQAERVRTPERFAASRRTLSPRGGARPSPQQSRSHRASGRETVLTAVNKLPIDDLMSRNMHGFLMD